MSRPRSSSTARPGSARRRSGSRRCALADARGVRVLQARPAESEAKLSYAALADLVGAVFEETERALPPSSSARSRRRSCAGRRTSGATRGRPRPRSSPSCRARVARTRCSWRSTTCSGSTRRRSRRSRSRRGGCRRARLARGAPPADGERAAARARACAAGRAASSGSSSGPLSLAALHHLISGRLGTSLSRPLLVRLADASGGNPFFALEIARALGGAGGRRRARAAAGAAERRGARGGTGRGASRERAHRVALAAAALSQPTVATVVEAVRRRGDARAALIEAEEAGVLSRARPDPVHAPVARVRRLPIRGTRAAAPAARASRAWSPIPRSVPPPRARARRSRTRTSPPRSSARRGRPRGAAPAGRRRALRGVRAADAGEQREELDAPRARRGRRAARRRRRRGARALAESRAARRSRRCARRRSPARRDRVDQRQRRAASEHFEAALAAAPGRPRARRPRLPEARQLHRRARPGAGGRARGSGAARARARARPGGARLDRLRPVLGGARCSGERPAPGPASSTGASSRRRPARTRRRACSR